MYIVFSLYIHVYTHIYLRGALYRGVSASGAERWNGHGGVWNSRAFERPCLSYQYNVARHTTSSRKYFTSQCSLTLHYPNFQVRGDEAGVDEVSVSIANKTWSRRQWGAVLREATNSFACHLTNNGTWYFKFYHVNEFTNTF